MPLSYKGIFFSLFFSFSFCTQSSAQFFDSIRTSLRHKPKIDAKIDSRNGFVSENVARIIGFKLGLDFNETFKLGAGYNFLYSDVEKDIFILNQFNERQLIKANFDFQYLAAYGEYVFYHQNPWEISILVHVGAGFSKTQYTDFLGESKTTPSQFVMLYEPYMTAQYRLFKYLGIGGGVGYRLAYSRDRFSRNQLSSPIYVFKLKIYFVDLYRDHIKENLKK